MAFKATVTIDVEFCSMCPYSNLFEHYNPGIPGDVVDIYCRKLHRQVHSNLERLECCSTGSSLTAEDRVPSDCPFLSLSDIHTVTVGGGYTQTKFSFQ